jgi:hypothetical protein
MEIIFTPHLDQQIPYKRLLKGCMKFIAMSDGRLVENCGWADSSLFSYITAQYMC